MEGVQRATCKIKFNNRKLCTVDRAQNQTGILRKRHFVQYFAHFDAIFSEFSALLWMLILTRLLIETGA